MVNKTKDSQLIDKSEFVQVTPTESPSESFLVTEHLQKMPNLFSRGLIYLLVFAIVIAVVYSLVSKVNIVIECRAVVRPVSQKIKVLSDRNGYIEKIFISEGQVVKKNAPLFLINSKESLQYMAKVEELSRLIPLKKEYFDTDISSALNELYQHESNHKHLLRIKRLKHEQNILSLNSIEVDINYWQKEIEPLLKEYKHAKKKFRNGAISIIEYHYVKNGFEKARTELKKLISQKEIAQRESMILEEEIEKEITDHRNKKNIFKKKIKGLELQKETILKTMQSELDMNKKILSLQGGSSFFQDKKNQKENVIIARNAGTVSELYFRNPGEYARESELLCTILPADSRLYMDITVPNKNIRFVEKDMEIRYKFDAFPESDYETLSGRISSISPSACEDRVLDYVYHVNGTLDKDYFKVKGKKYYIKTGMTAIAQLVLAKEKKSIFSMFFK